MGLNIACTRFQSNQLAYPEVSTDPEVFTAVKTRIVRGSDYSPASEIFSRVRKTMTGNNPKLDLLKVDAHKMIGHRFCQNSLKVLSGNKILTSIKGHNSVKSLQK